MSRMLRLLSRATRPSLGATMFFVAAVLLVSGAAKADTWSDPAGDGQGGPDVTTVTVANETGGPVTMTIPVPQNSQRAGSGGMMIVLDVNRNGSDTDPVDRAIVIFDLYGGLFPAAVFKGVAPGGQYETLAAVLDKKLDVPSLKISVASGTVEVSFAPTELGIDTGFSLWIGTVTSGFRHQDQWSDRAPDSGHQAYALSMPTPPPPPAVVRPVIGKPTATPSLPTAGRKLAVTFPVTRSDNGKPLGGGTMTGDPSITGKVLKHVESFTNGKARLSFAIPKAAKGRQLKIKVVITFEGDSATRLKTYRIR